MKAARGKTSTKMQLCLAPVIPEAVPPTVKALQGLIKKSPNRYELYFSLGNLLLREGNVEEALNALKKALKINSQDAGVYCNLGICFFSTEHYEEAIKHLKQAVLLEKNLMLAHRYIAQTYYKLGKTDEARQSYRTVLAMDTGDIEAYEMLGLIALEVGDNAKGKGYFEEALANGTSELARNKLCEFAFEEGKKLFKSEDYLEAFSVWKVAHEKYQPSFSAHKPINDSLSKLVKEFNDKKIASASLKEFEKAFKKGEQTTVHYHTFLMHSLFSLRLVPEHFVLLNAIETELSEWKKSLQEIGEHPYPHYKIGIALACLGETSMAIEELMLCYDRLPEKKHASLSLKGVLDSVKQIRDIERANVDKGEPEESRWEAHGFTSRFVIESWRRHNIDPALAAKWRDAEFSPNQAVRWIRAEIEPKVAQSWQKIFIGDIERAVQWLKAGFDEPHEALQWIEVFMFPWDALQWRDVSFTPTEAAFWTGQGIKDPFEARAEQDKQLKDQQEPLNEDEDS